MIWKDFHESIKVERKNFPYSKHAERVECFFFRLRFSFVRLTDKKTDKKT